MQLVPEHHETGMSAPGMRGERRDDDRPVILLGEASPPKKMTSVILMLF